MQLRRVCHDTLPWLISVSLGPEHAMSQQSDMAERVYHQLAHSEVSAAELVQQLRAKWGPEHRVPEVHRFVEEVAACILHHDDLEVGEIRDGAFSPWRLEPWESHDKIARELLALDTFLDDKTQYVFRKRKT